MSGAAQDEDVRKVLRLDQAKSSGIIKWILLAVVVVGVLAGAVSFARHRAAAQMPRYLSERVHRADVSVTVSATGKLQGLNTVEVGAEVTGKVLRVLADYNDEVKKGQVLAEIDPEQLKAALEEARAQVLSADANTRTAKATLVETKQARVRAEEQAKQGLISQKELEAARAAAARAQASVASASASATLARASLKSAESRLSKTRIVSPIDGIVLSRSVEPGQTVTAGFQTPVLFRVAEDLTKLALHVDVDEADIGHVKEGASATFSVDAYPERSFSSRVVSLRNDPKSTQGVVSYEAVLSVDNSERLLRPGMTATATITAETVRGALVVPNAALRFSPPARPGSPPPAAPKRDEKRVFVLRGGALTPVPVKVGVSDGHVTQLLGGALSEGSEVVTDVDLSR